MRIDQLLLVCVGGSGAGLAAQKAGHGLGAGGAAALADAGLAAAPAAAGGVQGAGEGPHVPRPAGQAVAAAFFGGGQGGAQAAGGLGQADGQPVQPVGVQPRHGEQGVLPGGHGGGQGIEQLGAQAVVGVLEGGQLGVDPADGV